MADVLQFPPHDSTTPANYDDWRGLGILRCALLPDTFPESLRRLPLEVAVGMVWTEWNCVSEWYFREFARSSVEGALERLLLDDSIFTVYGFRLDGAVPMCRWDADWPLFQGGERREFMRRTKIANVEPWNLTEERTVFELRNEPVTPVKGRLYLRVGGRTQDEARRLWHELAGPLRRLHRSLRRAQKQQPGRHPI